jgi:hypothetical protein
MGLRPLDDKSDIFHNEGSKENGVTFLSLRGGPKSDAAIYRVSEDAGVLSLRVVRTSGSPRAFSPRDDKVGWFHHEGSEVIGAFTLSLRGGSGARDAAIHRVSGDADDLALR